MNSSTISPWAAEPGDVFALARIPRLRIVCVGRRGARVFGYAARVDVSVVPAMMDYHPTELVFIARPHPALA